MIDSLICLLSLVSTNDSIDFKVFYHNNQKIIYYEYCDENGFRSAFYNSKLIEEYDYRE